jgi:general secretion pathway protein B
MSYILDALKKSEAERSRGSVPTLLIPPQTQFRSGVAVWVLLAALVVNACLFAAWMFWPASPTAREGSTQVAAPAVTTSAPPPNDITASRVETPSVPPAQAIASESSPESGVAAPPIETVAPNRVEPQEQAPRDDSEAPTFSFSTHVYASDPAMRAVTMNGKRFVEGDTISPGVRIKEITETGVVLDVNGRTVPMDVLQDWR